MTANHTFSNPASKDTQKSVTTGGFQASAGAGEVQAAKRTGKALRGGSSVPQPLQSQGKVHEVLNVAPDFLVGYLGADPQRDTWITQQYGKAGITGVVAKGRRR